MDTVMISASFIAIYLMANAETLMLTFG